MWKISIKVGRHDHENARVGISIWANEQSIREVYLKAFQPAFEAESASGVMTSYTRWGTTWAGAHEGLITGILRGEWGYAGLVMSDWWTRGEHYKEILAGNDLKMANGYPERVEEAMKLGAVNRSDLKSCARRVLELILEID